MNERLQRGQMAPHFTTTDMFGQSVPFCNLRVHDLSKSYAEWRTNGLDMLAVFQSPVEKMSKYVGSQHPPFPLLPDPAQRLYRLYGVEHGWKGLLSAAVGRVPEIGRAVFGEGFLPGSVEGGIHRIPADFLIDPYGLIARAYYGKDIGDHLPLAQVPALMADGPMRV